MTNESVNLAVDVVDVSMVSRRLSRAERRTFRSQSSSDRAARRRSVRNSGLLLLAFIAVTVAAGVSVPLVDPSIVATLGLVPVIVGPLVLLTIGVLAWRYTTFRHSDIQAMRIAHGNNAGWTHQVGGPDRGLAFFASGQPGTRTVWNAMTFTSPYPTEIGRFSYLRAGSKPQMVSRGYLLIDLPVTLPTIDLPARTRRSFNSKLERQGVTVPGALGRRSPVSTRSDARIDTVGELGFSSEFNQRFLCLLGPDTESKQAVLLLTDPVLAGLLRSVPDGFDVTLHGRQVLIVSPSPFNVSDTDTWTMVRGLFTDFIAPLVASANVSR